MTRVANVRYWHKAEISLCGAHVRFRGKADMPFCAANSAFDPKRAISVDGYLRDGGSHGRWRRAACGRPVRRLLMARPRSQRRSPARPRRILIVEDDLVIALMMEEIVREMGCAVSGIAGTLGMARLQFAKRDFDAVLLDVNLGGEYNPETADLLLEMGVPFAFVTGYDYVVEPRHDNVPLLQKPFSSIQLRVLVEQLLGSVPSGGGTAQTV